MGRLDDKVALVTGGARGMGASHVRRFIAEGARVMFTDILDDEGAALAEELGDKARFHRHDVTSEPEWQQVVDATIEAFGRIDILVNNAGILNFGPIVDMPVEDFRRVLEVNLVGEWIGLKTVGKVISEGGSIVNISSVSGLQGSAGTSCYTASKFGVTGITECAAHEFGPRGVRVNSVHPGAVATMMTGRGEENLDTSSEAGVMSRIPLKRYATAADVTNVVLFLASDESTYITGSQYVVDGGMTGGLVYS
ncbi:glucose 1-dehydrogenase [Enemella sp. A6]|uniref:glucose 1-dehydrogenase n=1 Tax=Enemella sp. A6 TaxID=3440152 RepID=UPI003EB85347